MKNICPQTEMGPEQPAGLGNLRFQGFRVEGAAHGVASSDGEGQQKSGST